MRARVDLLHRFRLLSGVRGWFVVPQPMGRLHLPGSRGFVAYHQHWKALSLVLQLRGGLHGPWVHTMPFRFYLSGHRSEYDHKLRPIAADYVHKQQQCALCGGGEAASRLLSSHGCQHQNILHLSAAKHAAYASYGGGSHTNHWEQSSRVALSIKLQRHLRIRCGFLPNHLGPNYQ